VSNDTSNEPCTHFTMSFHAAAQAARCSTTHHNHCSSAVWPTSYGFHPFLKGVACAEIQPKGIARHTSRPSPAQRRQIQVDDRAGCSTSLMRPLALPACGTPHARFVHAHRHPGLPVVQACKR
jgi:hypothetical protein